MSRDVVTVPQARYTFLCVTSVSYVLWCGVVLIGVMTGQQPFHAIALFYIVLPFIGVVCMVTWKYTRCCCKYALSAMVENVCDILDIEVTVRHRTREESRGTYKYTDYGNN